jgi:hypothetical protein
MPGSRIGIGGLPDGRHPCHTTRHAGPHRAVRELEVHGQVLSEPPVPSLEPFHPRVWVLMQRTSSFVADGITPGFTVRYAHPPRSPQHLTHGLAALHVLRLSLSFGPSRSPSGLVGLVLPLLRPLLTSRSGSSRRPFRHKARSPQVRTHTFIAQPPHLRHLALVTRALQ